MKFYRHLATTDELSWHRKSRQRYPVRGRITAITAATAVVVAVFGTQVFSQTISPEFAPLTLSPSAVEGSATPDFDDLAERAEAAKSELDADALPDLAEAAREYLARAKAADDFLRRKTGASNYERWKDYLKLDLLRNAIEDDSSPSVQAREATALQERLTGIDEGLELTRLGEVRSSTERLIAAARFRDPARAIKILESQLDLLAERLGEIDRVASTDDAAVIGTIVGVLVSANQTPDLIASIRRAFGQPNYRVHVPERTVQAAVQRNVDQSKPVRDCILGTRLFGTANVRGVVRADLRPSLGDVHLVLSLNGRFRSNNIGYNGPVTLNTVGDGLVNVTRAVHLSESGAALEPAYARVSLNTQITSINHHLRLVRRIARKRAAEQKPQADAIATAKLRARVTREFVEETDQATAIQSPDLLADVLPYLRRLDIPLPDRLWGSTDTSLFIRGHVASIDQIAAPTFPPAIGGTVDLAIQLHESAIENTLAPILAGRRFDQAELDRLFQDAGIEMPERSGADPPSDEDDFEIRFTRFRPIVFESRDQRVRIGLRGSEFSQDGRQLRRTNLEIAADYAPVRTTDGAMWLSRQGDVEVSFPGKTRLSLRESAIRSSLNDRFDDIFPLTLLTKQFTVPQTVRLPAFRGRVYRATVIDARDGWLTIGVR